MPRKYMKNPTIGWMMDDMDTLEVLLGNWVNRLHSGTTAQRELQVILDSQKFEKVEVLCRMFAASAKFRRGTLQPQRKARFVRG